MASLNHCAFIGNIGKIELRYLSNGDAATTFTVAVNEKWTSKDGEKKEKTTWVPCVAYRKLAEILDKYCKVGSSIYVSGKFYPSNWEKDGVKHYKTEIIVDQMQMLDGKGGGGGREADDYGAPYSPPQPNRAPVGRPPQGRPQAQAPEPGFSGGLDDFDDDIPF